MIVADDEDEVRAKVERLRAVTARYLEAEAAATGGVPPLGGDPGMDVGFLPTSDLTSARGEEGRLPAGTVDEVMELVRSRVAADSWQRPASCGRAHDVLVLVHRPDILKECARVLEDVRPSAHRCVRVEAQAVDVGPDLAARLARGAGGTVLVDRAVETGEARRVFYGSVTAFSGQRAVVALGTESAHVAALKRPAEGDAPAGPHVGVAPAGGTISVRPSVGEDPSQIALDIDVRSDDLDGFDGREGIEMARSTSARATATLTVPDRTWALLGGGTRVGERTRFLFVRATFLPRKAGS